MEDIITETYADSRLMRPVNPYVVIEFASTDIANGTISPQENKNITRETFDTIKL